MIIYCIFLLVELETRLLEPLIFCGVISFGDMMCHLLHLKKPNGANFLANSQSNYVWAMTHS
jgi:hypothetical protein